MPVCPYCRQEVTTLYSSPRIDLVWYDGKWVIDLSNGDFTIGCSACYEELGPKDLDTLSVSAKLR